MKASHVIKCFLSIICTIFVLVNNVQIVKTNSIYQIVHIEISLKSRFWLQFTMIRPNVTFTVRTENSEITTVSRDVPKVSLQIHYDS